jgi:polar amino acid transport system substrate-binding protein
LINNFSRRRPRTQVAVILLLTLLPILLIGADLLLRGSGDDTLAEVHRRGALYVGIEGDNPPFAVLQNDEITGFDADLAQAIAESLGVDVYFVIMGYDSMYDSLDVGRVDVLVSAMWVNPDMWGEFRYSDTYFDAGQVMVVPAGSELANPDDLDGHTIGVEFGSEGDVWARQQQRRLKTLDVKSYDAPVAALDALADGVVDAVIIDRISFLLYAREGVELAAVATVSEEPYAVVTRVESGKLREAVNTEIRAMIADGRLDEMVERWF